MMPTRRAESCSPTLGQLSKSLDSCWPSWISCLSQSRSKKMSVSSSHCAQPCWTLGGCQHSSRRESPSGGRLWKYACRQTRFRPRPGERTAQAQRSSDTNVGPTMAGVSIVVIKVYARRRWPWKGGETNSGISPSAVPVCACVIGRWRHLRRRRRRPWRSDLEPGCSHVLFVYCDAIALQNTELAGKILGSRLNPSPKMLTLGRDQPITAAIQAASGRAGTVVGLLDNMGSYTKQSTWSFTYCQIHTLPPTLAVAGCLR